MLLTPGKPDIIENTCNYSSWIPKTIFITNQRAKVSFSMIPFTVDYDLFKDLETLVRGLFRYLFLRRDGQDLTCRYL